MKSPNIIIQTVCGAALLLSLIAPAIAGPGQIYVPVTTRQQAEDIKPGTRIAVQCPNCGGVTTTIAGDDRSYLRSYTCETCKKKFVVREDPHGGIRAAYICEDDEGHRAKLLQAK